MTDIIHPTYEQSGQIAIEPSVLLPNPSGQPVSNETPLTTIKQPELLIEETLVENIFAKALQPEGTVDLVQEKQPTKTKGLMGRLGLAATFALPTADLFLSDGFFGRIYASYTGLVERNIGSPIVEKAIQYLGMAAFIAGQCVGIGLIITKNRRLRESFKDYDDDLSDRQEKMNVVSRAVSKAAHAPINTLGAVGDKFEKAGAHFEKSDSTIVRHLGKATVKAGHINAVGTTNVFLTETLSDETPTPTVKSMTLVGGLFALTWLGAAEGIRYGYRGLKHVPVIGQPIRTGMAKFGQTYEFLTDVWHQPAALGVMGLLTTGLFASGWSAAKYQEKKQAEVLQQEEIVATTTEVAA